MLNHHGGHPSQADTSMTTNCHERDAIAALQADGRSLREGRKLGQADLMSTKRMYALQLARFVSRPRVASPPTPGAGLTLDPRRVDAAGNEALRSIQAAHRNAINDHIRHGEVSSDDGNIVAAAARGIPVTWQAAPFQHTAPKRARAIAHQHGWKAAALYKAKGGFTPTWRGFTAQR